MVLTLESIHPGLNHTVLGLPVRLQQVLLQYVSLDDILHTAGWSSESTFAKFYNKPIVKDNTFADKVLSNVSNTDL